MNDKTKILTLLKRRPCTVPKLSRALDCSHHEVRKLLGELAVQGKVQKRLSEDRRNYIYEVRECTL